MQTLSYGYKKPANPDTGDQFYPALEQNIQQLNDHTHNGTDSAPLASRSVSVTNGSWSSVGGGIYRQSVSVPTGLSYDTCSIRVIRSTGEAVWPTMERISASAFYLYTNDNTLAYTCLFR